MDPFREYSQKHTFLQKVKPEDMDRLARKIGNLQALMEGRDPTPSPCYEEILPDTAETPTPRSPGTKRRRSPSPAPRRSVTLSSMEGSPPPALVESPSDFRFSQRRRTPDYQAPSWDASQVSCILSSSLCSPVPQGWTYACLRVDPLHSKVADCVGIRTPAPGKSS